MWCNPPELQPCVRLGPDPPHWQGRQEPGQKLSGNPDNRKCGLRQLGKGRKPVLQYPVLRGWETQHDKNNRAAQNKCSKHYQQKQTTKRHCLSSSKQASLHGAERVCIPGLIQAACLPYGHQDNANNKRQQQSLRGRSQKDLAPSPENQTGICSGRPRAMDRYIGNLFHLVTFYTPQPRFLEICSAGQSFPSTLPPPPDKEQNPDFKRRQTLIFAYEIQLLMIQYVRKLLK